MSKLIKLNRIYSFLLRRSAFCTISELFSLFLSFGSMQAQCVGMKKSLYRIVSVVLIICMLVTGGSGITAFAADNGAGTYTVSVSSTLNVRSGPGTNYSIVGSLTNGTVVEILETSKGWGKFTGNGTTGWISLDYAIYTANPQGQTVSVDQRNDIVKTAMGELGYKEGKNNYTKYGVWYSSATHNAPWCAIFVCWCAYQIGIPESVIPRFSFCYNGITLFQNLGVWKGKENYVPLKGDIIFFRSDTATSASDHVGIVTAFDGTKVYTIEGNSSDAVSERKYDLTDKYIVGYASPNYKVSPPVVPTTSSSTTVTTTSASTTAATQTTEAPARAEQIKIIGAVVNVRTSPDNESARFATQSKNKVVDIISTETVGSGEVWYKVSVNGKEGYVSGRFVQKLTQETEATTESTAESTTASTTASTTTTSSTTSTTSTTTTSKSTTASTTTTTRTTTTSKPTAGTSSGYVYITGDYVNIRAGAGTGYSKIGSVNKAEMYTFLGTVSASGGTWYKINYKNADAYVSGDYSRVVTSVEVTGSTVNIRSGPSTDYSKVTSVRQGDTLVLVGFETANNGKIWYKVAINGYTGYIISDYCKLK